MGYPQWFIRPALRVARRCSVAVHESHEAAAWDPETPPFLWSLRILKYVRNRVSSPEAFLELVFHGNSTERWGCSVMPQESSWKDNKDQIGISDKIWICYNIEIHWESYGRWFALRTVCPKTKIALVFSWLSNFRNLHSKLHLAFQKSNSGIPKLSCNGPSRKEQLDFFVPFFGQPVCGWG